MEYLNVKNTNKPTKTCSWALGKAQGQNTLKEDQSSLPGYSRPRQGKSAEISKVIWQDISAKDPSKGQEGSNDISLRPEKTRKMPFRANSAEEVDLMSDETIRGAVISGFSKVRVKKLVQQGQDYVQAKRTIIKANITKHLANLEDSSERNRKIPKSQPLKGGNEATRSQKRPRSTGSASQQVPHATKKANTEALPFKDTNASVKIAVADAAYPEAVLDQNKLKAVENSIVGALDAIPEQGPQVRFVKCVHRPGFLVISCADNATAQWLRETVPILKPWEEATLVALEGEHIPKPWSGVVYVPDEGGQRLSSEKILKRLKVSNRTLNTDLWTVLGATPAEKGAVWTFAMDKESKEEIQKLNLFLYFGMGRLHVRIKEGGRAVEHQTPAIASIGSEGPTISGTTSSKLIDFMNVPSSSLTRQFKKNFTSESDSSVQQDQVISISEDTDCETSSETHYMLRLT